MHVITAAFVHDPLPLPMLPFIVLISTYLEVDTGL